MKINDSLQLDSLRQKAEERLNSKYTEKNTFLTDHLEISHPEADRLKLVHELEVYRIELEMQNEELKLAVQKTETATALYDFAPVGYFTLSPEGTITQLNLQGAKMLGKERFNLLEKNIKQFIPRTSQQDFINFIKAIFQSHTKQTCELRITAEEDSFIFLHLEGIMADDLYHCLLTAIDITEHKQREETLKQTQTNLTALVNNRDESIWSIDTHCNLLIFNHFFRDECFASYNIELKPGMNVLSILPPHLSQLWKQKYEKALMGKRVVFEYSNPVGQEIHQYEVFLNPILFEGQITGVTALSGVITLRKKAEEALRKSEERHRLLADNASDVIWTMDLEGQFTYVSPSVEKLLGYSVAEMMLHPVEEILSSPSGHNALSALKEAFNAMRLGLPMRDINMEVEQNCKNGSTLWTDVSVSSMFNKEGEFVGLIGVTRNIAQRKRVEKALRLSEIKYRKLYESLIDSFVCVNMEGRIIDCNHAFEKMLGYSREELFELHYWDLTPEKWREKEQRIVEEQIIPNGYSQLYEKEYIRKDGSIIPIELRTFVIRNEMGENEMMAAIVRDITENKRIKEALSKSEQLYHSVFENSNANMLLVDPETGVIVDANLTACHFYGYSREQLKALNISDINMMSGSQLKAEMAHTAISKQRYNFRHKLADSTIREVEVYACPIEVDKRTLIHSIIHDITDRKLAEEALAASEIRLRSLLQNVSSVAVQGYYPDGRIHYWNHASEHLYGYTSDEAIGKNIVKLIVPSDDQEAMKQAIGQMVSSGQPIASGEISMLRRNGSRVEVFANHAIVHIPGRAPELFCFDIDLSDRKQAEKEVRERDAIFSQMLENSPIYIYFKDEKLRIMHMSRNYQEFLGKSMDELIGKTMEEIYPPHIAELMYQSDMEVLQNGTRIESEMEIFGRNFSFIKFPIQVEGKSPTIAGFNIDITERKHTEIALKESEARLLELNATKDKFFSIIAHDLKSPFNSIIGFSNLLSRQIHENDYQGIGKYANIIQQSSQRALNLLMNLLEWTRSQTGRMEFNPEIIDLSELTDEITKLSNDSAQYKSITINTDIKTHTMVLADRLMIGTVLRNLLSNAIKFTHPGGQISIYSQNQQDQCIVTVSDTGVGIKKEALDKLFRIDVSYSTVGTQDEVGTGLGLILCKDFIDKNKGKIWVESSRGGPGENSGTKFHFTLPLAPAEN